MVWGCSFAPPLYSTVPTVDPDDDIALANKKVGATPPQECDYEVRTTLFKRIEERKWYDVSNFIESGQWPGISSLFPDLSPRFQATTVVTKSSKGYGDESAELNWRRLPLQQAVISGAPLTVIQNLVKIYPEAVRWANNDGQLALHLAMLYNASDDVVAFLIQEYPNSIMAKTKIGSTPLQSALQAEKKDRGMVIAVFINYSKLLQVSKPKEIANKEFSCEYRANCEQLCPLYLMIERGEWGAATELLETGISKTGSLSELWSGPHVVNPEEQCKTWVTSRDLDSGEDLWSKLPLHQAILSHAPFSIVKRMIELYPQAVLHTDDRGFLPIHLALYHNVVDAVVAKLLLEYPDSVNVKTRGGLTPLECARRASKNDRGTFLDMFILKKQMFRKQITKPIVSKNEKKNVASKTAGGSNEKIVAVKNKDESDPIEKTRE